LRTLKSWRSWCWLGWMLLLCGKLVRGE